MFRCINNRGGGGESSEKTERYRQAQTGSYLVSEMFNGTICSSN